MSLRREIYALGTNCIINIDSNKEEVINEVISIIYKYQDLWSYYLDNSDIGLINRYAFEKEVDVSRDTILLLERLSNYYKLSNGYFDISIRSNINDYKSLIIDKVNNRVRLHNAGQKLDLGGIAKGTIANIISKYLNNKNISYILDLGGQISIYNIKDAYVGIQDPFSDRYNYCAKTKLNNEHITTSGIYERYNKSIGVDDNHIINPKTRKSITDSIYSVSVIYNNAEIAEFLSTSIIIMGINKSKELLKLYKDAKVIVIDKDKKIFISNNLKDNFQVTNSTYKLEIIEVSND